MTTTTIGRRAAAELLASTGSNIVDLGIYQGDDMRVDVTFTDSDGAPINPSLWLWRAQIRPVSADADAGAPALADFTPTVVSTTLQLHLDHTDAANLPGGTHHWDLEGTRVSDGWVTTYLRGAVVVTAEVTR